MNLLLLFAIAVAALLLTHRLATHLLITVFYRLSHNLGMAMTFYALLIWPGTILHEVAHWLMAFIVGVPATLPHLLPGGVDGQGRMVLGYVKIAKTDPLRHALIGVAPLLAGSAAVVFLASYLFTVPLTTADAIGAATVARVWQSLPLLGQVPNGWLLLYLLVAIANAMLPSPSDRDAWPVIGLFLGTIGFLIVTLIGLPQLPPGLLVAGARVLGWLTFAFLVTAVLDGLLIIVLYPIERLLHGAGR